LITETGKIQIGQFTCDWAHIKKPNTLSDMLFGTVALPNNRRLDIYVHQKADDMFLVERIFKLIIESFEFKDNQLLEAGSKIVAEIKKKGLKSFFDNQAVKSFFLVKNKDGRIIGFTIDTFENSPLDVLLGIKITGSLYLQDQFDTEQITFFQGDNTFDQFVWRSEISSVHGANRTGTEILSIKDRGITITEYTSQTGEKHYLPSPAAIPEIFFEIVLSEMLDGNCEKIMLDIIDTRGTILPTVFSKVAAENDGYVLTLEILNGSGFSEQIFLDSKKQIVKRLLQHETTFTMERTNWETIAGEFPQQVRNLLQKVELLE
jgi:hypothetical protein